MIDVREQLGDRPVRSCRRVQRAASRPRVKQIGKVGEKWELREGAHVNLCEKKNTPQRFPKYRERLIAVVTTVVGAGAGALNLESVMRNVWTTHV